MATYIHGPNGYERVYGAGQGNPMGWTWDQLMDPPFGTDRTHMASCCLDDLIDRITELEYQLKKLKREIEYEGEELRGVR